MINIKENFLKIILIVSFAFINYYLCNFQKFYYFYFKYLRSNFSNNSIKLFLYKENQNFFNFKNEQMINITLSLDNSHIYPTLVLMTSALENNDKEKHLLIFYLLLSHDFNMNNIKVFESLKSKYNVGINYYCIPNLFKSLRKWKNSTAIYYKLLISLLIPNTKKIIHLDGDTLVFKDLYELFNLPFNDNYYLAQPTRKHNFKDKKMIKRVINVGVILINIEKLRNENKDFEILYYLFNKNFTEQLAINYVCNSKIGYLPFKYGIFANIHKKNNTYNNYLSMKLDKKVNKTEVIEAINNPSIVHILCCNPKHWYKRNKILDKKNYEICIKYHNFFVFYAKKTKYYNVIYNIFMK